MLYKVETGRGFISIDKSIIGRIAYEALKKFKGKVFLSNHKGKILSRAAKWSGVDPVNYMEITYGKKGLDIRIYIVIRFGTSIGLVTDQLITAIKEDVERFTGIEANSIAIVVTGVILKQVLRRNIEVKS